MTSRHYKEIMAKMPETCVDNDCRDTNWGGRGREHYVGSDCPMYQKELQRLQREDQVRVAEAINALPKNDHNAEIQYNIVSEQVSMSLDAFLAIAKHFQQNIEYGLIRVEPVEGVREGSGVYKLPMMPYKEARDLAEIGGARLVQKFESGWIDA
jgi:hypothetical protein